MENDLRDPTDPTTPAPDPDPAPNPAEVQAPPPAATAEPPATARETTDDDRNFAMLGHLLGAFTSFVGPLVIWLVKKDESPFAAEEAKESLNFQITLLIAYTALGVLTCGFGVLLYPVLMVAQLIFAILGAMKAKDGVAYRYPLTLRLVK